MASLDAIVPGVGKVNVTKPVSLAKVFLGLVGGITLAILAYPVSQSLAGTVRNVASGVSIPGVKKASAPGAPAARVLGENA